MAEQDFSNSDLNIEYDDARLIDAELFYISNYDILIIYIAIYTIGI